MSEIEKKKDSRNKISVDPDVITLLKKVQSYYMARELASPSYQYLVERAVRATYLDELPAHPEEPTPEEIGRALIDLGKSSDPFKEIAQITLRHAKEWAMKTR